MKRCDAKWRPNDWVIYYLAKMAKSNSLVASPCITMHDRANLQTHVLDARKGFQLLMGAGKHLQNQADSKQKASKAKKANKTQPKKTTATRRQRAPSISDVASQASEATTQASEMSEENQSAAASELPQITDAKMAALPNVHAALHFPSMTFEYEVL